MMLKNTCDLLLIWISAASRIEVSDDDVLWGAGTDFPQGNLSTHLRGPITGAQAPPNPTPVVKGIYIYIYLYKFGNPLF